MKKAIIVGCNGQDGTLLSEFLKKNGYDVLGISRDSINILDNSAVDKTMKDFQPDEIYYLAAVHHSSEEEKPDDVELFKQSYETHAVGLINFLEAIVTYCPEARLFYAASSHIFGLNAEHPQNEETPVDPDTIYGVTKATGMMICRYYRKIHSVFASVGILYTHESHLRSDSFLSKRIINTAKAIKNGSNEKLVLGNLKAEVDWGYAVDYIECMNKVLNIDNPDDFVIATGITHTVEEFVEEVFSQLGLDWKDHVEENSKKLTRQIGKLIGDFSKVRRATGWKPSVDFKNMIKLLIENG